MKSLFAQFYWALVLTVTVSALGLLWVIGSESGGRWALQTLAEHTGIDLQIDGFSGTLVNGFSARHIAYHNPTTTVEIDDLTSRYTLSALLNKQIAIDVLQAKRLAVTIAPPKQKKREPLVIRSPWPITLGQLDIDRIDIHYGATPLAFTNNHARLHMQGDRIDITTLATTIKNHPITLSGNLRFTEPLSFHAQGEVTPPALGVAVHAKLDGDLDQYRVALASSLEFAHLPPMPAQLTGVGNLQGIDIRKLVIHTLDGTLEGRGNFSWKGGIRSQLAVTGTALNPAALDARFPGKLSLEGKLALNGAHISGEIDSRGTVRGFPLNAQLRGKLANGVTTIEPSSLVIDDNRIEAQGQIFRGAVAVLDFRLDGQNLDALYPGLAGKLSGQGKITGHLKQPVFSVDLEGHQVVWNTIGASHLSASISPGIFHDQYDLSLRANALQTGSAKFKVVTLESRASSAKQKTVLLITGGPAELGMKITAEGVYSSIDKIWNGVIQHMTVSSRLFPPHALDKPATLKLSPTGAVLAPLCLKRGKERFCAGGQIDTQGHSSASLDLSGLPLGRFGQWAPQIKGLHEQIDAKATLEGEGKQFEIAFDAGLDPRNRARGNTRLDLGTQTVDGSLTADFDKLQWLQLFNEDISHPHGKLHAQLAFKGPLASPDIFGDVTLHKGGARVPDLGIELSDVALDAHVSKEKRAHITGSMASGDGDVKLEGDINWATLPNWWMTFHLTGDQFLAANLPEANVAISPDLRIAAALSGMGVSGTIKIPKAEISLGDLSASAIEPSPDEVILGEEKKPDGPPWPFIANVKLALGERVAISGFGLHSRLAGDLNISQRSDKAVEADGAITLVDGEYKAYGQQLKIEKGALYFNGPLKAPRLDMRASRKIDTDNVTVGLKITGTLEQPESKVFSVPPMNETDALAYLLTGKPLSGLGESDSNMLLNAAVRLGLKSSAGALDKLRDKAGLDTFAIQAGNELADSAVILGKYLTPDLYIQYMTKLFNQSETFSIKYRLSSKLHLEAESDNENQSMDLIYQIEKN